MSYPPPSPPPSGNGGAVWPTTLPVTNLLPQQQAFRNGPISTMMMMMPTPVEDANARVRTMMPGGGGGGMMGMHPKQALLPSPMTPMGASAGVGAGGIYSSSTGGGYDPRFKLQASIQHPNALRHGSIPTGAFAAAGKRLPLLGGAPTTTIAPPNHSSAVAGTSFSSSQPPPLRIPLAPSQARAAIAKGPRHPAFIPSPSPTGSIRNGSAPTAFPAPSSSAFQRFATPASATWASPPQSSTSITTPDQQHCHQPRHEAQWAMNKGSPLNNSGGGSSNSTARFLSREDSASPPPPEYVPLSPPPPPDSSAAIESSSWRGKKDERVNLKRPRAPPNGSNEDGEDGWDEEDDYEIEFRRESAIATATGSKRAKLLQPPARGGGGESSGMVTPTVGSVASAFPPCKRITLHPEEASAKCAITWRLPFPARPALVQLVEIFSGDFRGCRDVIPDVRAELPATRCRYEWKVEPGCVYTARLSVVDRPVLRRSDGSEELVKRGHMRPILRGEVLCESVFSNNELKLLMVKAMKLLGTTMHPFEMLYRCKPKYYWDQIVDDLGGWMRAYEKDLNGHAACPINGGRIRGLFFNGKTTKAGGLPDNSPFGDMCYALPAHVLLDPASINLYFADFYCNAKAPDKQDKPANKIHYATVVVTKKGSPTDEFCARRLLVLKTDTNFFLRIVSSTTNSSQQQWNPLQLRHHYYLNSCAAAWIEIYWTEDIADIRREVLRPIMAKGAGTSRIGGLPNDRECILCNLEEEEVGVENGEEDEEIQVIAKSGIGERGHGISDFTPQRQRLSKATSASSTVLARQPPTTISTSFVSTTSGGRNIPRSAEVLPVVKATSSTVVGRKEDVSCSSIPVPRSGGGRGGGEDSPMPKWQLRSVDGVGVVGKEEQNKESNNSSSSVKVAAVGAATTTTAPSLASPTSAAATTSSSSFEDETRAMVEEYSRFHTALLNSVIGPIHAENIRLAETLCPGSLGGGGGGNSAAAADTKPAAAAAVAITELERALSGFNQGNIFISNVLSKLRTCLFSSSSSDKGKSSLKSE